MKLNGIHHQLTAPYHPASNGLAERAVQTLKEGIKKLKEGSIQTHVSRFLFTYCITHQTTTDTSPAELLMNRKPRSLLDLFRPNIDKTANEKQTKQKEYDRGRKQRIFDIGDKVFVRNFAQVKKWLAGTVKEKKGPLSFVVETSDGRMMQKHMDHIDERFTSSIDDESLDIEIPETFNLPNSIEPDNAAKTHEERQQHEATTESRYPMRERKAPSYRSDYQCSK